MAGGMFGMSLRTAKAGFFDRQKVMRAVEKARRRVLNHFRRSIRRRKGYAAPGESPHSHVGLLKDFIFYAYDFRQSSVVIGPALLHRRTGYGTITVPEVLEYGAAVRRKGKRCLYEPRPYMGPAFEKAQEKLLPDIWRDSVK